MPLSRPTPGQPFLGISVSDWEQIRAAIECIEQAKANGLLDSALSIEPLDVRSYQRDINCVNISNDTGNSLVAGNAVDLGQPLYDCERQLEGKTNPGYIAELPSGDDCGWGIVVKGSTKGCSGKVALDGVHKVQVICRDESHGFVKPIAGEIDCLETVECSSAQIVGEKPDTVSVGEKFWALIRLGNCPCEKTCDCGLPANSSHCGTFIGGGEVEIGDETYPITVKGGTLVPGEEVLVHVTDDCQKVVFCCRAKSCEFDQLFLCQTEGVTVEQKGFVIDDVANTITWTICVTCLADLAEFEVELPPMPCDSEFCGEHEMVNAGSCNGIVIKYGNVSTCCDEDEDCRCGPDELPEDWTDSDSFIGAPANFGDISSPQIKGMSTEPECAGLSQINASGSVFFDSNQVPVTCPNLPPDPDSTFTPRVTRISAGVAVSSVQTSPIQNPDLICGMRLFYTVAAAGPAVDGFLILSTGNQNNTVLLAPTAPGDYLNTLSLSVVMASASVSTVIENGAVKCKTDCVFNWSWDGLNVNPTTEVETPISLSGTETVSSIGELVQGECKFTSVGTELEVGATNQFGDPCFDYDESVQESNYQLTIG